jgi:hypothetical protein
MDSFDSKSSAYARRLLRCQHIKRSAGRGDAVWDPLDGSHVRRASRRRIADLLRTEGFVDFADAPKQRV